MGAAGAAGIVGAFGAVIVLALAGPAWAVAWLVLVIVLAVAFQRLQSRRRERQGP